MSVVHVSSAEAEAQRQLTREIETVREDRKRVPNRIQGVLATQGVRMWAHLDAIEARLAELTAARDEHIATGTDRVATVARQLCTLRVVAETSAAVFSAELFGTRTFSNPKSTTWLDPDPPLRSDHGGQRQQEEAAVYRRASSSLTS